MYRLIARLTQRTHGFKLAKEAGFDGVEINTLVNDAERHETKALAIQHQLEVFSVMNSKHWACPLSDADDTVRAESREGMLDSIATATAVGADTVLLVPAVVNEATPYEAAYERSQARNSQIDSRGIRKRHHNRH